MRSRKVANDQVAEVARRRLELLSAELAGVRGDTAVEEMPEWEPEPVPASPGRHARRPVGSVGRVGGWLHDRLPVTLQGRVGLAPAHVTVVALLVAAGVAAAAWWVVRAEPASVPVLPSAAAPASPQESPGASSGTSPAAPAVVPAAGGTATPVTPTAAERAVIVVDVAGKVRRPGIATLPSGSRVIDALEAAGGARKRVDLTSLNLARVLVDGEQIVVGIDPPDGVAAAAASAPTATTGVDGPAQLVNLNSATSADLDTLPGVGPVTAESILAWRSENGAFTAVDELLEVSGIGEVTLAEIAPFVTI